MASQSGATEPEPPVDGLVVAIQALREIYDGCSVTGRWLSVEGHEAVGHNPTKPDTGYYDRDNPPADYDAEGWIGTDDDDPGPDERLIPSEWEDYSLEEQSSWLRSCASTARRALEKLGVALVDARCAV
jgi:hypothetical protein